MANKFRPLTNDYAKWALQAAFQPEGTDGSIKLGDIEALGYTPNITEIERYSREYAEKTLTRSDVIQKDAALTGTLLSITPLVRGILFMDNPASYLVQEAVVAATRTIANPKVGVIYGLGKRDVTITSFDDGAAEDPVEYVLDTHYRLVAETGDIEIIMIPDGALTTSAKIVYGAAAITETEQRQSIGIMANNGVRGKLTCWGINDIGEAVHIEFWDVKLTPTGEVALQGGDDYTQVQIQGRVYADGTKTSQFRYGRVTVIQ